MKEHTWRIHNSAKPYTCDKCDFKTPNESILEEHINSVHEKSEYHMRRSSTKFCAFYNNSTCNNAQCEFDHKAAPPCRNDGNCERSLCMFQHHKQDFQRGKQMRPGEIKMRSNLRQPTQQTSYRGPVWESQMGNQRWGRH